MAYLLQHLRRPRFGFGQLVAAVSRGRGGEDSLGLVGEGYSATSGEREQDIALHGLYDGHHIPHALSRVAVALHIDLLDGMCVGPPADVLRAQFSDERTVHVERSDAVLLLDVV